MVSFNEQFHDNPLIKRFGTSELTVHHIKSLGTPNGKNKYQTWLTDDAVDIYWQLIMDQHHRLRERHIFKIEYYRKAGYASPWFSFAIDHNSLKPKKRYEDLHTEKYGQFLENDLIIVLRVYSKHWTLRTIIPKQKKYCVSAVWWLFRWRWEFFLKINVTFVVNLKVWKVDRLVNGSWKDAHLAAPGAARMGW